MPRVTGSRKEATSTGTVQGDALGHSGVQCTIRLPVVLILTNAKLCGQKVHLILVTFRFD